MYADSNIAEGKKGDGWMDRERRERREKERERERKREKKDLLIKRANSTMIWTYRCDSIIETVI